MTSHKQKAAAKRNLAKARRKWKRMGKKKRQAAMPNRRRKKKC